MYIIEYVIGYSRIVIIYICLQSRMIEFLNLQIFAKNSRVCCYYGNKGSKVQYMFTQ